MKRNLVNTWELKVSLSPAVTDSDMAALRDRVREAVDRELTVSVTPSSFVWMTRGAQLFVRTEGSPFPLAEIIAWVLMNLEPSAFELAAKRTAPIAKIGGWQGYARD